MPHAATLEELSSHIAAIQKVPGQLLEDAAPEVDLAGLRCIAQQLLELSRERRLAAKVSVSWPRAAVAVLLALGALITWIPALSYNFNGGFFMDDAMIKKNPNVYEELNWLRLFRTDYWGLDMFQGEWTHKSFRPLTVLSFRWNHALAGFEGSGFHVVNVLLNWVCSVLMGVLGFALGLPADFALLLGALFLAHPVHTESVLYIVGRADLLCLLLILVAALLYTPCVKELQPGFLLLPLSAVLMVAAGLCKETGFCFFGLLAGWEILGGLLTSWRRGRVLRILAMLLLGSLACGLRVWYTGTAIENMDPHSNPIAVHVDRGVRLRSYALLHGIYMKLLVFPNFLSYDYSFDAIPLVLDASDCRLLLPLVAYQGFFMLLALSLSVLHPHKQASEAPIVGMAILLLSFVPMSNILFPVGTMIGERLLYIPSAGLLLTVVSLVFSWKRRNSGAALLCIAGALGIWRCAVRVPEWKDSESITTADGLTQLNSARVQFNLANVYLQAKQYDLALDTYQRSINIDPTDHDALPLYHAGQILFFKGQHQEAARYLEKAVNGFFSPLTIQEEEIWHDYALSLWFVQKPQASIAHFQKALSINPTFTKASQLGNPTNIAMNNMACAAGLGAITGILPREYYQHAINALDQAVRLDPANVLYWRNAVALMSGGGDESRAAATWQQLVAMDPQGAANPPKDCSWEFYFR
ncbi:unnamed protein product [Durusdinium trenchii]|uniref:Uncharacterized protein n=3 Tax=Durusdinium trenchii TaxID=1381693 RepID=A0ABP0J7V3_9DINO